MTCDSELLGVYNIQQTSSFPIKNSSHPYSFLEMQYCKFFACGKLSGMESLSDIIMITSVCGNRKLSGIQYGILESTEKQNTETTGNENTLNFADMARPNWHPARYSSATVENYEHWTVSLQLPYSQN